MKLIDRIMTRRVLVNLIASLALIALVYALAGFVVAPSLATRYLPGYLEDTLGAHATFGEVRFNPFLFDLEAKDMRAVAPDGAVLGTVQRLSADWNPARLLIGKGWSFDDITIEGLALFPSVDRQGRLNFASILDRVGKARTPAGQAGTRPRLLVDSLHVVDGSVAFADLSGSAPAKVALQSIDLRVSGLDTAADAAKSPYTVSAMLAQGGTLQSGGAVAVAPLAAEGEIKIEGVPVAIAWPFVRDTLRIKAPTGLFSANTHYTLTTQDDRPVLSLDQGNAEVTGLRLADAVSGTALAELKVIRAAGLRADLQTSEFALSRLEVREGRVRAARAADGTLDWARLFVPADKTPSSNWRASVERITLANIAADYADSAGPRPLEASVANGEASLRLSAAGGKDGVRATAHALDATLSALTVANPGGERRLLALDAVRIGGGSVDTGTRTVAAKSLGLAGGHLNLTAADFAGQRSATPSAEIDERNASWNVRIDALVLAKIAATYSQPAGPKPLTASLGNLNGTLKLASTGDTGALVAEDVALALSTLQVNEGGTKPLAALDSVSVSGGRVNTQARTFHAAEVALSKGQLNWTGDGPASAGPAPLQGRWRGQIESVAIDAVAGSYARGGRQPLALALSTASANFGLDVGLDEARAGMVAKNAAIEVKGVTLEVPGGQRMAAIETAKVSRGWLDLGARRVGAAEVALAGGSLALTRTGSGRIEFIDAVNPAADGEAAGRPARGTAGPATPAWQYALGSVRVAGIRVAFEDRTFEPAGRYEGDLQASVENIESGARTPMHAQADFRLQPHGTVNATLDLAQNFRQGRGKVDVNDIGAPALRPWLSRYTAMDLRSGSVTATANLRFQSGDTFSLVAEGPMSLKEVLIAREGSDERLVSWQRLDVAHAALRLAPDSLTLSDVRVLQPVGKIVVNPDRTVNLAGLIDKPAQPAGRAGNASRPANAFPVRVDRVRLDGGTLDFADLSLVMPFAAKIVNFQGTVAGISSDPREHAELEVKGDIEPFGSAQASGSISLSEPSAHTDITARFANVQMPLLTPYAATFAGRTIDAGKLWLDLEYKVDDKALAGTNRIVLADFKLGERVEAPNALDLPLDLAVALLTESDGRIRMAIPVRGQVGSPEFDYGALIRNAVRTAIARVVSAPFRFIAGLFGGKGGGDELRTVEFEAGSHQLLAQEREELASVAEALKKRPALKLVVNGPYATKPDSTALRSREVRARLAQRLGMRPSPGEDPGPVALDDPRTQRALVSMLDASGGGAVQGPAGDERQYYAAIFDRLVEREPLPETAPRLLATRRAAAIIDFLVESGADPARVTSGSIREIAAGGKSGIEANLELEVSLGAAARAAGRS